MQMRGSASEIAECLHGERLPPECQLNPSCQRQPRPQNLYRRVSQKFCISRCRNHRICYIAYPLNLRPGDVVVRTAAARPIASSIASSSSPSFGCGTCQLLSRTPTDRPESNQPYYENEYVQGFTTNLPSDAALSEMKWSNFANTYKCFSYYLSVLL